MAFTTVHPPAWVQHETRYMSPRMSDDMNFEVVRSIMLGNYERKHKSCSSTSCMSEVVRDLYDSGRNEGSLYVEASSLGFNEQVVQLNSNAETDPEFRKCVCRGGGGAAKY